MELIKMKKTPESQNSELLNNEADKSFSFGGCSAEKIEGDNQNFDEDFMGEHFENLGDVWHAVFGDNDHIVQYFRVIIEQGELHDDCKFIYPDKTFVALLQYPPEPTDIHTGALVVKTPDSDQFEFLTIFPIMEGLPNSFTVKKSHTWENGVEGVVAAEHIGCGETVSFFAPFYFRDFASFAPKAERTMHLAALALSCEKAELQEFIVESGGFFEVLLQKFLESNPSKTKEDFSPPVVSMLGARILFPSKYACRWEYRCPVLRVEQTSYFGRTVYKVHIIFVGRENQELAGYLYIPEHMLRGYVPQAGDDIEGVLWMTGYLGD